MEKFSVSLQAYFSFSVIQSYRNKKFYLSQKLQPYRIIIIFKTDDTPIVHVLYWQYSLSSRNKSRTVHPTCFCRTLLKSTQLGLKKPRMFAYNRDATSVSTKAVLCSNLWPQMNRPNQTNATPSTLGRKKKHLTHTPNIQISSPTNQASQRK